MSDKLATLVFRTIADREYASKILKMRKIELQGEGIYIKEVKDPDMILEILEHEAGDNFTDYIRTVPANSRWN